MFGVVASALTVNVAPAGQVPSFAGTMLIVVARLSSESIVPITTSTGPVDEVTVMWLVTSSTLTRLLKVTKTGLMSGAIAASGMAAAKAGVVKLIVPSVRNPSAVNGVVPSFARTFSAFSVSVTVAPDGNVVDGTVNRLGPSSR